ncbi:MAG: hypothetical protein V3T42_11955 [Nitrospirales bacterium]
MPSRRRGSVQQGHSYFGGRNVHRVREHGKMARTPLAAFFNIPYDKIQWLKVVVYCKDYWEAITVGVW